MEPSKLHRYLVSLCRADLVRKADIGLYDLGPGALELGGIAFGRLDDLACVEALVSELVERLRETAFIYVWTQSGPVMIRSRTADHTPVVLRLGTIAPLIGSASGPVFVAHLPREVTWPIIQRDAAVAGVEVTSAEHMLFEERAPRIRTEGVNVSDVTLIPNNLACAGPVFDAQGDLLFVIGTSMRRVGARKTIDEVATEIKNVCAETSRRLGYRPPRLPPNEDAA